MESKTYSGRILSRVPKTLHRELIRQAELEGVSLNQFIVSALSSAVGQRQLAQELAHEQELLRAGAQAVVRSMVEAEKRFLTAAEVMRKVAETAASGPDDPRRHLGSARRNAQPDE